MACLFFPTTIVSSDDNPSPSAKKNAKFMSEVKKALHYVFSLKGVKDTLSTYMLLMACTACHELGHAIAGKIAFGSPIEITLGSRIHSSKSYLKFGGIELGGFDPVKGEANIILPTIHEEHSLKYAATIFAGPLLGHISELSCLYYLLKNSSNDIAKLTFISSLMNDLLPGSPTSDGAQLLNIFKTRMKRLNA